MSVTASCFGLYWGRRTVVSMMGAFWTLATSACGHSFIAAKISDCQINAVAFLTQFFGPMISAPLWETAKMRGQILNNHWRPIFALQHLSLDYDSLYSHIHHAGLRLEVRLGDIWYVHPYASLFNPLSSNWVEILAFSCVPKKKINLSRYLTEYASQNYARWTLFICEGKIHKISNLLYLRIILLIFYFLLENLQGSTNITINFNENWFSLLCALAGIKATKAKLLK